MDRNDAKQMVEDLLHEHAYVRWVNGWGFGGFTRANMALGHCDYQNKVIRLSGVYVDHNDTEHVKQTILHEIAHALTPGHNHDARWLAVARSIGYVGGRQAEASMPDKTRWVGRCGQGCEIKYMRKPGKRTILVGVCVKHRLPITWVNTRTKETARA